MLERSINPFIGDGGALLFGDMIKKSDPPRVYFSSAALNLHAARVKNGII
jgi:hypothetical protein